MRKELGQASSGLRTKYIVHKADTGEPVDGCFVLRPQKDWAARFAVKAYAEMTDNPRLRHDLLEWIGAFPVSSYDPDGARIDQSALFLKPCPRCGGKGLIYYEGPSYYYAECEDCPLELHDIYLSAEGAARAWNYRAEKPNEPLTLDQLRKMDGEPVWLTIPGEDGGEWVIVHNIELGDVCIFVPVGAKRWYGVNESGDIGEYGKTWLAYRRRPGEDANGT